MADAYAGLRASIAEHPVLRMRDYAYGETPGPLVLLPDGSMPVDPGHPVTLGYLIMNRYPCLEAAEEPILAEDLVMRPTVVADACLTGSEGTLLYTLDMLHALRKGVVSLPNIIESADAFWGKCSHVGNTRPGLVQAHRYAYWWAEFGPRWVKSPISPVQIGDPWGAEVTDIKSRAQTSPHQYVVEGFRLEPAITDKHDRVYFEVFLRSRISGAGDKVFVPAKS